MKKENNKIKIIFSVITGITLVTGLILSYLLTRNDDAPIFILISLTIIGSLFIYGVGNIITNYKENPKDIEYQNKIIRLCYSTITGFIIIVGLFFSVMVAELDDAPGFVLLGTAVTLAGSAFIYGVGEITIQLKSINNQLKNKN